MNKAHLKIFHFVMLYFQLCTLADVRIECSIKISPSLIDIVFLIMIYNLYKF